MENVFLYRLIRLAILLGIFSVAVGCASTPANQETFKGEGFKSSLPKAGTRVVVWGNHSGAVSRTLGWLQDHQILGVGPSWIQKELSDPGFARRTRREQHAKVLAASKSVGAPLVLFAQVEDSQLFRKFDLMSFGHKHMKIIEVEIRAMKAETGDVVFGGKAWNSEPLVESEQIVQDLTTFALQKAWNESDRPLPLQQEVAPPTAQQEEEGPVASSYSAEMPPALEPTQAESTRPLPLQQEVAPPTAQQEEEGPVASSYSAEMPPALEPTQAESTRPLPLQQEVAPPTAQQEEGLVASSYSAEMPPKLEPSQSETVEPQPFAEGPPLGLQVASGALSVLYTPLKVVYAGLGGFMGGFAYLLTAGNDQVAQSIWERQFKRNLLAYGKTFTR